MNKKKLIAIIASALAVVIIATVVVVIAVQPKQKKDSIIIMSEELSGLFNPFYATSGADMDVIGMTQIGMLSTDSNGNPVAGKDESCVVEAFDKQQKTDTTVYTFVIKNGLKFSNGSPLTMNDVMFNIYEYLDPVYTGSSTMYSIDIVGLNQYRTQTNLSDDTGAVEENLNRQAETLAKSRMQELMDIYHENGLLEGSQSSHSLTPAKMKEAIQSWNVSTGYKQATALKADWETLGDSWFKEQLVKDYELVLKTFREELESDYNAAQESFDVESAPYKDWADKLKSEVFKFLLYEGKITPVYAKLPNSSRDDKNKIEKFENEIAALNSAEGREKTKEEAIDLIYNDNINSEFLTILSVWGTAGTMQTLFAAEAKDILLHANLDNGELAIPNISGIKSLGHAKDVNVDKVTVNGVTYNVAKEHNADGTPKEVNTHDVLQITINGVDPKAIYNFGFTVAPAYYYSGEEIDIANNKFGVKWSDSGFQSNVIQAQHKQEVPVGAGPYMATDADNNDNPSGSGFVSSKIVYFKANPNFMFDVKTEKIRFQVVSSTNAIDKLANGEVDYITPQFTLDNAGRLKTLEGQGIKSMYAWQLGYGYVGINAGKVPNINIRRAIMASMQTSLALEYYQKGTVKNIDWPMSMESWAYPWNTAGDRNSGSKPNGHDYTQWPDTQTRQQTIDKIKKYMNAAGVSPGDASLKMRFTIAGTAISEHPLYPVFIQAAEILNSEELGWEVEVKADSQALTKLATGSLTVWAAAWGSTIDPDMYQVYHKNSSATSVYAWGYREIKANPTLYQEETKIINELSAIIDDARSIDDQARRSVMYEEAMGLVLDLAVELPVYQRQNLYAYNANKVKGFQTEINPYTSPLEKVWELEIVG